MATNLGESVQVRFAFDQDGAPYTPVSVTVTVKLPDGTSNSYGPGAPVINDAVGSFYYILTTSQLGSTVVLAIGIDAAGNFAFVPEVVEVVASAADMPRVMTSSELEACIGAATVDQLFDDNGDGLRDPLLVAQLLRRAEDYALTYMLAGWADTQTCVKVMQADSILRMHIAWVAAEYMAERRKEFLASDGKGPYINQYTRAETYFDKISIAALASVSEQTVGANAQSGGVVQPALAPGCSRFVFAPDKNSPFGHGGF